MVVLLNTPILNYVPVLMLGTRSRSLPGLDKIILERAMYRNRRKLVERVDLHKIGGLGNQHTAFIKSMV